MTARDAERDAFVQFAFGRLRVAPSSPTGTRHMLHKTLNAAAYAIDANIIQAEVEVPLVSVAPPGRSEHKG